MSQFAFLPPLPLAQAAASTSSAPAATSNYVPPTSTTASPPYAYTRPFIQPAPVWDYWYLLLIPLALLIAIVYKSVKCSRLSEIPRAAVGMTWWITAAFVAAAVALLVFVRLMQ